MLTPNLPPTPPAQIAIAHHGNTATVAIATLEPGQWVQYPNSTEVRLVVSAPRVSDAKCDLQVATSAGNTFSISADPELEVILLG